MEHSIAHAGSSHGSHHPSSTSNAKKKGSNGSQNQHPSSAKRPNVSEAERDDEEEADSPAPELDEVGGSSRRQGLSDSRSTM
jgi:hypothetical protein